MKFINDLKAYFRNPSESDSLVINVAALAIIFLAIFSVGFTMGSLSKPVPAQAPESVIADTTATTTAAPTTTAPATTAAPVTTAPAVNDTAAQTTTAAANGAPSSIADILALYNESANKVKTNASKVTKNFEDREVLTLQLPSVLQSLGDKIMGEFMGDDTEPIEYATAEDIKASFIVPGQDYASKLTEADISAATCTDNGTQYELELTVKGQKNPTAGVGVGAGFDVIETGEISSNSYASMLETFDVTYTDCVIKCKIDKATGNMVWASYYTPVEMHIVVSMFGTHNVTAGISFLKDYTIAY